MAEKKSIAAELVKVALRIKLNEQVAKLDYEVDCVVSDLRQGRGGGLNTKKLLENLKEARRLAAEVEKVRKDAELVWKVLKIGKAAYDAADKSATIGSALNPAAAAIGFAVRLLLKAADVEIRAIGAVLISTPIYIKLFKEFLKRSQGKITRALLEKAMKENVKKDRTNTIG